MICEGLVILCAPLFSCNSVCSDKTPVQENKLGQSCATSACYLAFIFLDSIIVLHIIVMPVPSLA